MPLIYRIVLLTLIIFESLTAIGTQFLTVPPSARELALGNQVAMNVTTIVNPASPRTTGQGPQLNLTLGRWLGDVKASAVEVSFSALSGTGNVGLRHLGLNDLAYYDERPMSQPLATWGAYGIALDGGWTGSFGANGFGLALHLIRIQMHTESATGFSLDLGFARQLTRSISVGAAMLNIGKMNALMSASPQLPLRLLAGFGIKFFHPQVPTEIGVTGEWSALREDFILSIGSSSTWKLLNWSFGTHLSPEVVTASAGFGIALGRYSISYGIQFGSQQVGLPQLIDLAVRLP